MEYEHLHKHFTERKNVVESHFFNCKRVPRKFKKKWKHILCSSRYYFLELGQKLWYIQSLTNNDFNRFLIKKMSEKQSVSR